MILIIRTHCMNLKKKGAVIKITEVEEINTLHESLRDGGGWDGEILGTKCWRVVKGNDNREKKSNQQSDPGSDFTSL